MIKSRTEILNMNHCFAEHLISVQKAKHEPSDEWSEGDSVILDDSDEVTVLTKKQAHKLNAEDLKHYLDNKDDVKVEQLNKWESRSTLVSSKQISNDYFDDIGNTISQLSNRFGNLIIMGDWSTPWLSQENDYPPVVAATKYLNQQIDEKFNGGFELEANSISCFIPHLFWLTRCNASLPEFMMSFIESKTVISLCKYGILHLEFYDSKEREEILTLFNKMNFKEVDRCNDPVEFDNMDGRQIVIND